MATGSRVPFSGLKEEEEEDEEDEEEEEEGFFQKVPTLPLSWLFNRRLWLGPQCSKPPLPSCGKQLPPAGPLWDGEGWLKSFQRSLRMCFTSKSFRPEPDMLYAMKVNGLELERGSRLASGLGRMAESGRGAWWEAGGRDAPCTPREAKEAKRDALPARRRKPEERTAKVHGSASVKSCRPALEESPEREQRQEWDAESCDSSMPV